jgi:hypothetical protein
LVRVFEDLKKHKAQTPARRANLEPLSRADSQFSNTEPQLPRQFSTWIARGVHRERWSLQRGSSL